MPKTGIEVFDAEIVYAGGIDPYAGDNGISKGKVFATPLHTYEILSNSNPYGIMRIVDVRADNTHRFRAEVEGIAGMICEERMGHASRLDDVLNKQREREAFKAQQARELNTLR